MAVWPDVKDQLRDFCMTTTVKGIPRIFKTKLKYMCVVWVVALLSFLAISLYSTVTLVQVYLNYPVTTKTIDYSVTSAVKSSNIHYALMYSPLTSTAVCSNTPVPSTKKLKDIWTYDEYKDFVQDLFEQAVLQWEDPGMLDFFLSPNGYFRNVPLESTYDLGMDKEDILVACEFTTLNGFEKKIFPCEEIADIETFSDPDLFTCLTVEINSTRLPHNNFPIMMSAVLYLESNDDTIYNVLTSGDGLASPVSAGAYLTFLSPGDYPSLTTSLAIPPGFESLVHATQSLRSRKSAPYGTCVDLDTKYYNLQGLEYKYSTQACLLACIMQKIADSCGCIEPRVGVFLNPDRYPYENLTLCGNLTNGSQKASAQVKCQAYTSSRAKDDCLPKCPDRCSEISTSCSASYLRWPKPNFQLGVYNELVLGRSFQDDFQEYRELQLQFLNGSITSKEAINKLSSWNKMEKVFAKFTITPFQESMSVVEDVPKYTFMELLSQVGGIMNLYSGISIIFLVECVELAAMVFHTLFTKIHSKTFNLQDKKSQPTDTGTIASLKL